MIERSVARLVPVNVPVQTVTSNVKYQLASFYDSDTCTLALLRRQPEDDEIGSNNDISQPIAKLSYIRELE